MTVAAEVEPASPVNVAYVTTLAAGAAIGGFLFGFDTSTMNSAINGFRPDLELGSGTVGFVVAIVLLGCAIGAWFAGPVSTRLGRNKVMVVAGALIVVGSLGAALGGHVLVLGLFRVLTGLGIGAASAVVPAYISEIAPTAIRGRLGSLWQFAIVFGQLLGLLAGYALTHWAGSEAEPLPWGGAAWRWMFAVVAVLGGTYLVIATRLPPSPPDLVRLGERGEARALLDRIGGESAEEEVLAIERAQAGPATDRRLGALRGDRFGLLPVVWAGILLAAFQQLVGISVVKTYSNTLWQKVGFSTNASFTISIITVLISIASTIVAISIIDKVGRRTMLATGAVAMAVALAILAIALSTASGDGDDVSIGQTAGVFALVAINLFAVAFGVTWGPVMWVMLSELFTSDLRTTAVAVCTAVNWMTNWAVTRSFPTVADAGLGVAYGLYTVFAAVAFVFVIKVLPETKDRSLS